MNDTPDLRPFRGLKELLRMGLPVLPAEEANEEILRLTVENLRLQAIIDRDQLIRNEAELEFLRFWDER